MSGLSVTVSFNTREFEDEIRHFNQAQVPYASAVALTKTTQDAQKAIKEILPHKFIIRNSWTAKGIRITSAKKQDWPHQSSEVGSIDERMVESEAGDTREHPLTGKAFSLPKAVRSDKRKLIPKSQLPGALLNGKVKLPYRNKRGPTGSKGKAKPFLAAMHGGNALGVLIRTDQYQVGNTVRKGRSKKALKSTGGRIGRQKLRLLYVLSTNPTHIPKKEWLVKTTLKVATEKHPANFERALIRAMSTQRR